MNEEIIIDGVDVSGCDRYNDFPCKHGEPYAICLASFEQWNDGEHKYCKDRPDCYYKQLKRLQAENGRLRQEIFNIQEKDRNHFCYTFLGKEMEYWLNIRKALEEIREHVKDCCHKFSSNHKDLCFGCEYDKEVCDYSIILDKINEVLKERE